MAVTAHTPSAPSDAIDTLFAAEEPLRRDLLLEYLHRLHDEYNALRPAHLRALADRLPLAETEVFEVASFYHHFELADDDTTPVSCRNSFEIIRSSTLARTSPITLSPGTEAR